MYKKSQFNIIVPYNKNEYIIFNSLSGALGKFDEDTLNRFNQNKLSNNETNILLEKGILVDSEFDEVKKINEDRAEGINNQKSKHFRIWPTSGCNARCYYCFEKGIKPQVMTTQIADDVVKYIDSQLNDGDNLKVEWFGGEPLLNANIIDYILKKLKIICQTKNCSFFTTMISNGSLIDEKLAKKMEEEWNLKLIQITLDGFNEDYNKIKNYCNPTKYNFDKVINGIKYLATKKIHITIRMNYDTSNYESLTKLIDYLHNELNEYKNISYYVYPVWSSINEDGEENFTSQTQADFNVLKLYDLLIKYKMGSLRDIARLKYKKHACQAWSKNSFVILPDGRISKCCEAFTQILGNIYDGIKEKELYDFWTNVDLDKKCKDCPYIPICQGGCKAAYFNRMAQCFMLKPIFNELIKWYVKHLDEDPSNIKMVVEQPDFEC